MSYSATVFKVMIASPSDVPAERNVIREVIAEWNAVNADQRKVVLLPVGWETHSSPLLGERPQAQINRQVLKGCDLLIGVFWTRLGTATGEYQSGTLEEIEEHLKLELPVMLYFSRAPVDPDSVDPEQYKQLKEFRTNCQERGLYQEYHDVEQFGRDLYRHLQLSINNGTIFADAVAASDLPELPALTPMSKLSKEACFLLKEAAKSDAEILHLHYLAGEALQVGGQNLIGDQSPRTRALWVGALEELESHDFVRSAGPKRQVFKLTNAGYEMADRLP
jgi:hypothetical protein